MSTRTVKLIDPAQNVLAIAHVQKEGSRYGGTIEPQDLPARLRALFDEFEQIVSDQMFNFLDEIQERIEALLLQVVFEDGQAVAIRDLQIYPTTGDISFALAEVPAQSARLA